MNTFANTIKELVNTNYASLDAAKMKVIVGHFYGAAVALECDGEFQYDNGYIIHYPGKDDSNPYNPYVWITDEDRLINKSFYFHNLPAFIYYAIRKWRKEDKPMKWETYNLTSSHVTNFDTVEETVSKFLEWVKTTHQFLQGSSEELFKQFFTDLGKSSILGEAYVKACIEYNGDPIKMAEYKQIPSSKVFYSVLKKILNRREWDNEKEISRWRKAIY